MDRLEKVINLIKEKFPERRIEVYRKRNIAGDNMETLLKEDGIQVDYCKGWYYLEIFGLTDEEFKRLCDTGLISW